VAYPARVLRIHGSNPGGLIPELVAADINRSNGGPSSWRRWRLRRLAAPVAGSFRAALSDLTTRRQALVLRIEALDSYTELLTDAVVAGAVTLPDRAADAAPIN
jgi:capsid protein